MFAWMVQVGALNSFVMWKKTNPNSNVTRKTFLSILSTQLLAPQIQRRSIDNNWIVKTFRTIHTCYQQLRDRFFGRTPSNSFWCHLCHRSHRDIAVLKCHYCDRNICLDCQTAAIMCEPCHAETMFHA